MGLFFIFLAVWKKMCNIASGIIIIKAMKKGDIVMISPEVTQLDNWVEGTIIDVEANPFVGTVISARTGNGDIFFEKECLFKKVS